MNSSKNDFLFSFHLHQPFGNFDDVIESTFRRAYRPLIDTLKSNPFVKSTIHISGPLLIWLNKNHPEFLEKILSLFNNEQIELLGGTYSEAILCTLPENEQEQQIIKYKELIHSIFNCEISLKGFWLTERVFSPEIIDCIAENDYKYIFLDDTHIKKAGRIPNNNLFNMRSKKNNLTIIPVNRFLRYNLPFSSKNTIINEMKKNTFCVHADDGEKFGDWPGMYEYLYEKDEHLKKILDEIDSENIEFINGSELIEKYSKDIKELYLPYSSYESMNRWSMYTHELIDIHKKYSEAHIEENEHIFYTGNFFNFFIKYPESNLIYRKNITYSELYRNFPEVYEELLKSQCCCAYWHGVFGGIYLPHLRDAIDLGNIKSEKILPEGINTFKDFEVLKSNDLSLTFLPNKNSINSLFDLKNEINIINSFSRKPEFYHKDIESPVYYDNFDRNSFRDFYVNENLTIDKYLKNQYGSQKINDTTIVDKKYDYKNNSHSITSLEDILINNNIIEIDKNKTFEVINNTLNVNYNWNIADDINTNNSYIVIELNLHNIFGSENQNINTDKISLKSNDGKKIEIDLNKKINILCTPIETSSLNHQKIDKIQQCYTLLFNVPLKEKEFKISLKID